MVLNFLRDFQAKKVQTEKKEDVWIISWLLFYIDYQKVVWCIYKKWFLQYRYFLFDDVLSQEKNTFFILEKDSSQEFYEICWKWVKNQDWKYIGYIYDLDINVVHKLLHIYIDTWYDFSLDRKNLIKRKIIKISVKAILAYEKDFIIIEDKQTIKENKKTLENIRKVFINIPEPNYNLNFKKYE